MAKHQNSVSLRARLRKASNCSAVGAVGDRRPNGALPGTHQGHDACHGKRENHKGHDPGHAVEARRRRRGQHRVAVLLNETLQHQAVAVATLDGGHQLVAHAIGVGAADMVALQQHLVAAAHAHQAVAETIEAASVSPAPRVNASAANSRTVASARRARESARAFSTKRSIRSGAVFQE